MQKTILKWAGNKMRLAERIKAHVGTPKRLIEPFVGSAAVALNIDVPEYELSDVNKDLIDLYRQVLTGQSFIDYAKTFFTDENNKEDRFYELRQQFNQETDVRTRAALFIYLNRHVFNGLCRYNRKGQFNTPFGRYKKPYFPEKEMQAFAKRLQHANFSHHDFRTAFSNLAPGDVVYCDPPYVALTPTASFATYATGGFNMQDQKDLACLAEEACGNGVTVIISNHDTQEARDLYKNASHIEQFGVMRTIAGNGDNRKEAAELLAVYR